MEETISMNTKHIYTRTLLGLLLAVCGLTSCSTEEDFSPTADSGTGLRFSTQGAGTRLGYDFERTSFDDKEAIGCVIAEVNGNTETFLCNTKWTYREKDGMLELQSDGTTGLPVSNNDENDKSLLTLNEDKTLKFCFYYPYIEGTMLQSDVERVMRLENSDASTIFYKELHYPNCATNEDLTFKNQWGGNVNLTKDNISDYLSTQILTGTVIDNSSNEGNYWQIPGKKYAWTEYPCFVNHTQGDPSAEGKINDIRLQNSDFLWVASPEIESTTKHTVNLIFQKKTATILVYCESKLADIYFTPSGKQRLLRGKQINLSTGELRDYEYNENGSTQQKNMYFNKDEHIVPCYRGNPEGQQYHFYRLVLPAQTGCGIDMHILGDFDRDGTTDTQEKVIHLSDDGLTELKEGYLYSIFIASNGSTEIKINDWKPDGWFEIEEVTE